MTNDLHAEINSFVKFLKEKKDSDGKALTDGLTPEMLYRNYFLWCGKSYHAFEKGLGKTMIALGIFKKNGMTYSLQKTIYEEYLADWKKKGYI